MNRKKEEKIDLTKIAPEEKVKYESRSIISKLE